ncbi:MAG: hypothetical protein HY907_13040 [Deltaproteobacteria bacterium]|nr:hypothetical protein [Deltaproteobacteria bacterium]
MSRRILPVVLAVALCAPGAARADSLVLAAEVGEAYAWFSNWDQAEPLTQLGLRAFIIDSDEIDLGGGIRLGKPWGGDSPNAGAMSLDFTFRYHDDLYGDENFEPLFLMSVCYSHLWAENRPLPPPANTASTWSTREGFGLRLGGGFLITADEFYFDMTIYGIAELLWPEPDFVAGGGLDMALGIYLD